MTHVNHKPSLGEGVFLSSDVSQILQIPYAKARRWMLEMWTNKFGNGRLYAFGDKGNKAINFYTLIEFYTYSQLRSRGVTPATIRRAHQQIASDLNTLYPFAQSIQTDGRDVWYERLNEIIKADGKKQLDLKKILSPFLLRIDFGNSGVAEKFFPLERSKNLVVDPKRQFGQVIISGRNIRADVIYKIYKSGEEKTNIKQLYNLSDSQLEDVIKFYKKTA